MSLLFSVHFFWTIEVRASNKIEDDFFVSFHSSQLQGRQREWERFDELIYENGAH